jgi:hypothetical protein
MQGNPTPTKMIRHSSGGCLPLSVTLSEAKGPDSSSAAGGLRMTGLSKAPLSSARAPTLENSRFSR